MPQETFTQNEKTTLEALASKDTRHLSLIPHLFIERAEQQGIAFADAIRILTFPKIPVTSEPIPDDTPMHRVDYSQCSAFSLTKAQDATNIEYPVRTACRILWSKGIATTYSSANFKNVGHYGYITVGEITDENLLLLEARFPGNIGEKRQRDFTIIVPVHVTSTVGAVRSQMEAIATAVLPQPSNVGHYIARPYYWDGLHDLQLDGTAIYDSTTHRVFSSLEMMDLYRRNESTAQREASANARADAYGVPVSTLDELSKRTIEQARTLRSA